MSTDISKLKIGFIGTGNIGSAMIKSIINRKLVKALNVFAFDTNKTMVTNLKAETGINVLDDNRSVVENSDIIFLTVKPNIYTAVLEEISAFLSKEQMIVSVAAGITTRLIKGKISNRCKVVRTMPNIACLAEEGMTAICSDHGLDEKELNHVKVILSAFGEVEEVNEELLDAVTAISGSSPAFVFIFIEALADSGVMMGIPRDKAYRLATQTVLGSAKLLLESRKHPGELKDMVCTPGGTTLQGVHTLELNGFRGIIMDAIRATALKSSRINDESN